MNVDQAELDDWADVCLRANTQLLRAEDALRRGEAAAGLASVENARAAVWTLKRRLVRAGAQEPGPAVAAPVETPLHLLDTPANRRYAHALREALEALRAVERERGITDGGASEALEDWLAGVELEVYGPAGRDERAE